MFHESARLYDAIYSFKDYAAEAGWLRYLLTEHGHPAGTLLDVACGTGEHLRHLRDHYRVEGLDLDPGMLDVARAKLPGVPFHQGDMRDFDLGRRFDGTGFELALRYLATDALWLEAGYNDLRPDSSHPGEFRTRFGVGYVVYNFGGGSRMFGGFKVEGSRRSDGSSGPSSAFVAGLNYTF